MDAGGETASSASYQIMDAAGQPGVVGTATSENYQVGSGFLAESIEVTDVGEMELLAKPKEFQLYQNYPNPFNPETTIQFDVKEDCQVTLVVYDLLGRQLAVLINEHHDAGGYKVSFDASVLPSGIYIYRIQMGTFHSVRKMIVLE